MTIRIPHEETPCIQEVSDNQLHQCQIMPCSVVNATDMYSYLWKVSPEI